MDTAGITEKLLLNRESIILFTPELLLASGILAIILAGLIIRSAKSSALFGITTLIVLGLSVLIISFDWMEFKRPIRLFHGMLRLDDFSIFFKILLDIGGILTVLMSLYSREIGSTKFKSEYYALVLSIIFGGHLLVMSVNLVMVFLSLETLSISAYILTGLKGSKTAAEGSLKYFLFGSVATAIMVYGFSVLYGVTGTLEFSSETFSAAVLSQSSLLVFVGAMFSLAGFLYKISATPFHLWAPDVYEAAPLPVVALFSVVPKLAGIAVFTKFILAIHVFGQSAYDWQSIICLIAMLSITAGNFSALWQNNPMRMMAYSSIAQSGFLLTGLAAFSWTGVHYLLFYATVFLLANFTVFFCLQGFQKGGYDMVQSFVGAGRTRITGSILLLIGFLSLTGIPPTGGFMGKLFIFTGVWDAYEQSGKPVLIWLLVFGLINTVVSIFYYLKIPYYSFMKKTEPLINNRSIRSAPENFLAFILVVTMLLLFAKPDLLMGLLNSINFVL